MTVALYARVSTRDRDQNPEVQLDQLRAWALAYEHEGEEYVDYASGRDLNRPEWRRLEADIRRRHIRMVAVTRLDRAFRSMTDLYRTLEDWAVRDVRFVAVAQPEIDTGTPAGKLLTAVLGALAEYEAELIRERVREGMARIKREGKRVGRPRRQLGKLRAQTAVRECGSIPAAARHLGVSASTLRRRLGGED